MMKCGRYYLRLALRSFIAFVVIFSISFLGCVDAHVNAATLVGTYSIAPGALYKRFKLAGDGSTTSSTIYETSSSDTVSGTIREGTTYYNVTLNVSDSASTNSATSTTKECASYQVDMNFTMGLPLGTNLDPTHLYSIAFNATPDGYYINIPTDASATCMSISSYVLFQGERYECGEAWQVNFMKHTSNAYNMFYVIEMSYIVTTDSVLSTAFYELGVNIDSATVNVYDHGIYNSSEDLKQSVDAGNDLTQEGNDLQEENNQLQEEANQTSQNIFDKISDFFGSFFENIINAFKSLFVPEDGYFEDFFTRLNDFFAEKLGMLYAPIDLFISVLTSIGNASEIEAGIPFPGIKWEDTWLIEPQTISLQTYANEFPELQEKLYFVTDLIMIGAVLMLLQNKFREVMQN